MASIWQINQYDREAADLLQRKLGVSHFIAVLMVLRGLRDPVQADYYLNAGLDGLSDPLLMAGMAPALARIESAVQRQEKIVIYGDYDVDGICSIVILLECLQQLGGLVDYYVPDRFAEGYGMNSEAVQRLAEQGCRLLITVDCGITSVKEVDTAADLGMDVIITDHHHPPAILPAALAIINPKLGCPQAAADLPGAGVALKLATALAARGNAEGGQLQEWLVLAALAAVADMVPLQDENRVIVKYGLQAMPSSQRIGLRQLIVATGLAGQPIQAWQIGYILGPRLNAAGRMDSARAGIELLMSQDEELAQEQARRLNKMNEERREVEEGILGEALNAIEAQPELEKESVLMAAGEGWNIGVLGIVASRLTALFHRPALVISWDGETGRGSARSPEGFDIYAALDSVRHCLLAFGGHKMAAGLSLQRDQLGSLRKGLQDHAAGIGYRWETDKRYAVDLELEEEDINVSFLEELKRLEPWGQGNPPPVFVLRGRMIQRTSRVGANGDHLRMAIGSNYLAGIAFHGAKNLEDRFSCCSQDLLFGMDENLYKGKKTIQLKVKDTKSSFHPDDRSAVGKFRRGLLGGLSRAAAELAERRPVVVVYPTYRSLTKHHAAMHYYFNPGKVISIHGHLSPEERSRRRELLNRGAPAVFLMTVASSNLFLEQTAWPANCRYVARLWSFGQSGGGHSWPPYIEVEDIRPSSEYTMCRVSADPIAGERVLIYANRSATIKKLRETWPDIRIESGLSEMGQRIRIRRSYWSDPKGALVSDGTRTVVWSFAHRFDKLILADSPLGGYEMSLLTGDWEETAQSVIGVTFGSGAMAINHHFLDRLYPSLDTVNQVWSHLLGSALRGGRCRTDEIVARLKETFGMSRLEAVSILHILADLNLCHLQKRSSIMAINTGNSGDQIKSLYGSPHWREGIAERAALSDWEMRLNSSLEW